MHVTHAAVDFETSTTNEQTTPTIEQIWRRRVGVLGVLTFFGTAGVVWLAPPQIPPLLRLLVYLFSGCGIFFYVQFLREKPWTRLFLILINVVLFLWSFWQLGHYIPALLVANLRPATIANLLGSVVLNAWLLIVEIQFLMLFDTKNWTRASCDITEWMQSKIFLTASVVATALLLASLNHLDQATHLGFFSAMPGQIKMEMDMTHILLYGFWGWGAWHVGLFAISLLLLASIASFLLLHRGAALIPFSCLLLTGWMFLCMMLCLGTLVTDPLMRQIWPLALFAITWSTGLGTLLSYWLYDAFRFAFNPNGYRAARTHDELGIL